MMQYEQGSAQPVCTRSVNAVRPATPGSMAAPQLPSPSPKRSAVVGPSSACEGAKSAAACRRSARRGRHSAGSANFAWPTCGVTARDDDARDGILAGDASNRLTRSLIGRGRHGAGVDEDEVGVSGARGSAPRARRSSSKPNESA